MIKRFLDWWFLRDLDSAITASVEIMDEAELKALSHLADKAMKRLKRLSRK